MHQEEKTLVMAAADPFKDAPLKAVQVEALVRHFPRHADTPSSRVTGRGE